MSDAPDQIWIDRNGGNWSPCSGGTQDVEYRRADLPPTLSAAMELPEVQALVKALREIRDSPCMDPEGNSAIAADALRAIAGGWDE